MAIVVAVLALSTATTPGLGAQSQTVADGAAAIKTFMVPTRAGAAYTVVPADGVRIVGAASGRSSGATVAVAMALPTAWASGRQTAGFFVTGTDTVPLTVEVPERRAFAISSTDAVIRWDRDSVRIELRNTGNVPLRVAADPVAHGGWRYSDGSWSVSAGGTVALTAAFRGRADGVAPSVSLVFRADGTTTRAIRVRVEGEQRLLFPLALGVGRSDSQLFLTLDGAGQVAAGLRLDGSLSFGSPQPVRHLWPTADRNYLRVTFPRAAVAIGEIPGRSAEGLVWLPLGLGWALTTGQPETRSVDVVLGWRDDSARRAGEFSWHVRLADRFLEKTQFSGSLFGRGGSTLIGAGDHLFGGAFRLSRAAATPWSASLGAARVAEGLIPIGSIDVRRDLGGAALAVSGRRALTGEGSAAVSSAGYGIEVKGRAGMRFQAHGFLYRGESEGPAAGVSGSAFTASIRSRPGMLLGAGLSGGSYDGANGRRLSLEGSATLRATGRVHAEAFYRVDNAMEAAWSGGVRVRLAAAGATGIVGVEYAGRPGDVYVSGSRVFVDLSGRAADRFQWSLRTSAVGSAERQRRFDGTLAAAFLIREGMSVFAAVDQTAGDGGGRLSFGLRKSLDLAFPAALPPSRPVEASGELEVLVRFRGAGAPAPEGGVSLAGPAGTIELPIDDRGRAAAVGLPPGLYTIQHIPPLNVGARLPPDPEQVMVVPGARSEVVIAAGYERRAVRVNDLGGP